MNPELTIYLISRIREKAHRFIRRELAAHGMSGLAPSHGDIFLALFQHEALTMRELADYIDRDKSTVTGLVDRLVRLGYVRKVPDKADSRISRVCLTPEGLALRPAMRKISAALLEKVHQSLDEEEVGRLNDLLERINRMWR